LVNKDDAKSSSIQIIFETTNPISNKIIIKDNVKRILFKNNGFPFRPEDWNRLKRIADGNPDEQKVFFFFFFFIFFIFFFFFFL